RQRPMPLEAPVMRTRRPRRSRFIAHLFSLPFLSHPFAALYPNLPDHDVVLEDFRNTETALSGVGALQHLQPSASLYPTESDRAGSSVKPGGRERALFRRVEAGLWANATKRSADCTPFAGRKGAGDVNLCRLCRISARPHNPDHTSPKRQRGFLLPPSLALRACVVSRSRPSRSGR